MAGEPGDLFDIGRLGSLGEIADPHVLDHAKAKWGHDQTPVRDERRHRAPARLAVERRSHELIDYVAGDHIIGAISARPALLPYLSIVQAAFNRGVCPPAGIRPEPQMLQRARRRFCLGKNLWEPEQNICYTIEVAKKMAEGMGFEPTIRLLTV